MKELRKTHEFIEMFAALLRILLLVFDGVIFFAIHILTCMKRKLICFIALLTLLLLLLPACKFDENSSLKTLTKPYIAHYECTKASYGKRDLLEDYEYIEIALLDSKKMELIYKNKNGERKVVEGTYTYDDKKQEFKSNLGILGFEFKEPVVIRDGKFTIKKQIASKMLILNFKIK